MQNKIVDLKYKIYNLMSDECCNHLINFFEENKNLTKQESSYKSKEKTTVDDNYSSLNLSFYAQTNEKFREPIRMIGNHLSRIILNYERYMRETICETYDSYLINYTDNIRILKYETGQMIKDHTDVGKNFRASCTINLNDDYEGGDFRFFNGKVKEKLKKGDSIIFPVEPIWIHGTEPITKGVRYSINCFLGEQPK